MFLYFPPKSLAVSAAKTVKSQLAASQLAAAVGEVADAWLHSCVFAMPAAGVAALSAAIGATSTTLKKRQQNQSVQEK